MSLILAGDVGGTKTNIALFDYKNGTLKKLAQETYQSKKFKNFYTLLKNFLSTVDVHPRAACFAVAGPCSDNLCKMTNLPWIIDAEKINKLFGIKNVTIINDFEAIGYGIEVMHKKDLVQIKPGKSRKFSTKAVLGAGTGLGEAFIVWNGHDDIVVASEGGHSDFAARNELEWQLKNYLKRKKEVWDFESVLSGPGLCTIYDFLTKAAHIKESERVKVRIDKEEKSYVIIDEALKKKDAACIKAVDMFVSFYGAEAGNLALKAKALGGVYLAGSIARTLVKNLKSNLLVKSFVEKSKMQYLLRPIPVFVVMNPEVGLLGAANLASKL